MYDLAGARDFIVEIEKGCDGKELIGDTEGIILYYIVHLVKRAIQEALHNIDTIHEDQTLKCIFHINKMPLYHFELLRESDTERSATFKESMDLIWSRIEYRQKISETTTTSVLGVEAHHPGILVSRRHLHDIEFAARRERNPTLPA